MHIRDVLEALRTRPFKPIRIHVTDGASYEVFHPELCVPGRRSLFVGFPGYEEGELVYDRTVTIDLVHITRIEPIPAPTANGAASS